MQISKALITAAGRGVRQYPTSDAVQKAMLPLVDRDGLIKPVLQIIVEETIESGIEGIGVVSAPGDEAYCRQHIQSYAPSPRSAFAGVAWAEEQHDASSIWRRGCGSSSSRSPTATTTPSGRPEFVGGAPCLLLGDHCTSRPRRAATRGS